MNSVFLVSDIMFTTRNNSKCGINVFTHKIKEEGSIFLGILVSLCDLVTSFGSFSGQHISLVKVQKIFLRGNFQFYYPTRIMDNVSILTKNSALKRSSSFGDFSIWI